MTSLSVVMTVHNGERHLCEAIDSVLAQSVTDFEFLIVDDASTDATPGLLSAAAARDSRIRVLRNEINLGPYPSLNRALTDACGGTIARQDADDISPPDRFAIQLAALESTPEVMLVTGQVDVFDEGGLDANTRIRPPAWQPRLEWELMFSNVIGAGGHVMFRRLLHGERVVYDTTRRYAEDYGLWCRLARDGVVVCPDRVVYRYRRHSFSITGRSQGEQLDCLAAIRREYRAPYLPLTTRPDLAEAVTRFWTGDGGRPLGVRYRDVQALLAEVRANFLKHIEQRYGALERTRLDVELNGATRDRLVYWLYRSARMLDRRTCRDLLAAGNGRMRLLSGALAYAAGTGARKLFRRAGS